LEVLKGPGENSSLCKRIENDSKTADDSDSDNSGVEENDDRWVPKESREQLCYSLHRLLDGERVISIRKDCWIHAKLRYKLVIVLACLIAELNSAPDA
jgi:hypothetical protein